MCETMNLYETEILNHQNKCESIGNSTLPLSKENCRSRPTPLAIFANQIQSNLTQRAKCNAEQNGGNNAQCDTSAKYTLQHLPDYHNLDLNKECKPEGGHQADCDNSGNAQDCKLACAGARYVTFRIDKDAGEVDCEPMVVNETYPELAAYIRQILKGNSARNAIYGINFEPCHVSPRKSKRNPYEILYPSVIENLLNKMFSCSSLSPEDLVKFSNFISILSRLNIKDMDAYFHMLRMRGVVLADVVDNFRKQFWQLKTVHMTKKEVAHFLKNIKNAVLFGDPKEERKRKALSTMLLSKALEEALQQAEQWAKELLGKKLTWPAAKTGNVSGPVSPMAKDEVKTETKPLVPILLKPNSTPIQKEEAKQASGTKGKPDTTPKPLVIKKETDPKFQQKKDDYSRDTAALEESATKKDLLSRDAKESAAKRDSYKTQVGAELKTAQKLTDKKDDSSTQKQKGKKEKGLLQDKMSKPDEALPGASQIKGIRESMGSTGKKEDATAQKSQAKQEPTPIAQLTAVSKKDDISKTTKDDKSQQPKSTAKSEGGVTPKVTPTPSSKEPLTKKSKEKDKEKDKEAIPAFVHVTADEANTKQKKKGDVGIKPIQEPKSDYYRAEPIEPPTDAEKISTRSMRVAPERDFRMRLAAALSAAQKYADKTLYVPDPHGVEDTPRGTKRFTTADVLEGDGKALLRRSASKVYNDSSQLFERFSFLTTGAHQPGYYEPWDVEFPWSDLQNIALNMARFYTKRMPDPNFSYRRGMEYYQAIFRRELEEINRKPVKETSVKKGK